MNMDNFEQQLNGFLKDNNPAYLEKLEQIKLNEPLLSGLILGTRENFSLVLLTPSRIISISGNRLSYLFLEGVESLSLNYLKESEKEVLELNIQFNQGRIKVVFSKNYSYAQHFLYTLQTIILCFKPQLKIPLPEIQKPPLP